LIAQSLQKFFFFEKYSVSFLKIFSTHNPLTHHMHSSDQ
jgi:hypothetical protein